MNKNTVKVLLMTRVYGWQTLLDDLASSHTESTRLLSPGLSLVFFRLSFFSFQRGKWPAVARSSRMRLTQENKCWGALNLWTMWELTSRGWGIRYNWHINPYSYQVQYNPADLLTSGMIWCPVCIFPHRKKCNEIFNKVLVSFKNNTP